MGAWAHRCCSLRVPLRGNERPRRARGPGDWRPLPPQAPMSRLTRRVPATCRREENPTPRRGPERPLAGTGVLWGPGPGKEGGGRITAWGRQKSPRREQDCFFPVSWAGSGRRSGASGSGWGQECVPLFFSRPPPRGGGGGTPEGKPQLEAVVGWEWRRRAPSPHRASRVGFPRDFQVCLGVETIKAPFLWCFVF